jgi:hypothetical protein
MGLAIDADNVLRLKPQNLLLNLPLRRRASAPCAGPSGHG